MSVHFISPTYKVIAKGKSKARYALGIEEGDLIKFLIEELGHINRGGRYSTEIKMYVNSNLHTTISQGELPKVLSALKLVEVR